MVGAGTLSSRNFQCTLNRCQVGKIPAEGRRLRNHWDSGFPDECSGPEEISRHPALIGISHKWHICGVADSLGTWALGWIGIVIGFCHFVPY